MRIQTAADALLTAPDSAANHIEAADKQKFARLLQAQPQTGALPEHGDDTAQVQPAAPERAVKSDAADTTVTERVTATATTVETGEQDSAAESPVPLPETTDGAITTTIIATTTALLPASDDAQARLTATLQLSAKTPPAEEQKTAATTLTTTAAKPAQAAGKPDAATPETAAGDNQTLPEPVGKPAPRTKAASHGHVSAAANMPDAAPTSTELNDANAATVTMTVATEPDHATATTDSAATNASEAVAANSVNLAQPNMPTAAELQQTLQSSPTDDLPPTNAANNVAKNLTNNLTNNAKQGSARGVRLPHSGKFLPPATDGTATDSNRSTSPDLFKQLADAAALQLPGQAPDPTAQPANQILTNAAVASAQAAPAPAPQQFNATGVPLPASTTATVATGDNSQALATPLLLSSGLAMHASGWNEETAHHIRWLKDHDLQSAEIQLHPAELGRLSISIDIKDGQASVQLLTGNAAARDLLEQSLPDLRSLLAQNGMSLTDSSVTQHNGGNQGWPTRFNPLWFDSDELKPVELNTGRPALFRSSGGSNRIDQYV